MKTKEKNNSLIIIPARGGSKGIPRKNIRPLAGYPLIFYIIKAAKNINFPADLIVSTDDNEIATVADYFDVKVDMRPSYLAKDSITLDPVIINCMKSVEKKTNKKYDFIFTLQPTSPLTDSKDINRAYQALQNTKIDSVISVSEKKHLFWKKTNNRFLPFHKTRLNRQKLNPIYEESGAIVASKRKQLLSGERIGGKINFLNIHPLKAVDIDTDLDFLTCQNVLNKKVILMHVVGRPDLGLGHVYRALTLANEFVEHEIIFIVSEIDKLAIKLIRKNNYKLKVYKRNELINTILKLKPFCIINDVLNTDETYTSIVRKNNILQINFEDLGLGIKNVDMVINALYEEKSKYNNVFSGYRFVCLRDEFYWASPITLNKAVKNLFICFGGTDQNNLSYRVISILASLCISHDIKLNVICGPGYRHIKELQKFKKMNLNLNISIIKSTNRISKYMEAADIAITAGGRTVFELVSMNIPTIVICSNVRETTHTFANINNGIVNLGHHIEVEDKKIEDEFRKLIIDYDYRNRLYKKIKKHNLKKGKYRVVNKIKNLLDKSEKRIYI